MGRKAWRGTAPWAARLWASRLRRASGCLAWVSCWAGTHNSWWAHRRRRVGLGRNQRSSRPASLGGDWVQARNWVEGLSTAEVKRRARP